MGEIRARTQEEKDNKRQVILDTAWKLFMESDGQIPTAKLIAERADISKGTVYVYFRTKEEIFLELLPEKLREWSEDAAKDLDGAALDDLDMITEVIIRYPVNNQFLMPLGSILRAVLENNAPDEAIIAMKIKIAALSAELGWKLSQRLVWLAPAEATELLYSIFSFLNGLWQHVAIPERIKQKMAVTNPEYYAMDLTQLARKNIRNLLEGYRIAALRKTATK